MEDAGSLMAVIGTAGRQDDAPRINRQIYDLMFSETLAAMSDWHVGSLVSGGAAVADHLAVRAFLEGFAGRLVLHLPAPFNGSEFVRAGRAVSNDAGTTNRYHRQFSQACGLDSLGEIALAVERGAEVHVGSGFKARNIEVAAAATHLLAFTFGAAREPHDLTPDMQAFTSATAAGLKDGGTAHTFREAWRCRVKRHVSLNWLSGKIRPEAEFRGPRV